MPTNSIDMIVEDSAKYYQDISGLFLPKFKAQESNSKAIAVNHAAMPLTFEQHVRAQVEQSRRRYFIFHELYRQHVWTRAVVDYIVRRGNKGQDRLVDEADPLNPDIAKIKKFFKTCHRLKSFKQLKASAMRDVLVQGQAYWFIEKNGKGEPIALHEMDARISFPITDLHGMVIAHVQVYNGQVVLFDTSEVIYFFTSNNGSLPNSISPLESLVNPIAAELNAHLYNAMLFENNLNIGAVFSIPDATDEQIESNKEYLRDQYSTPANAHRPLILKGDAKLLRDGALALKDINFTEMIALTRHSVCAVYGIPESLVGISTSVNRSEGDNNEYDAYVNTILPLREDRNEQISSQLIQSPENFNSQDVCLEVPLSSKLPTPQHLKAVSSAADLGVYTFNEMREMSEAEPVPNGDVHVMKIPGAGGFIRPDLTALPGLGDPHWDMEAYQLEHLAETQMQKEASDEAAMQGIQLQAPQPDTPYIPPRPQERIQQEHIASRIVNVARAKEVDKGVRDGEAGGNFVYRRTPMLPGTRGGKPYVTSTGRTRYGPPPKGKQAPINAPDGSPNANTLTNPRDPNSPKRLTPEEKLGVHAAQAQVQFTLRKAQQENWDDEQFISELESHGWQPASGTQESFYDSHDALAEARRLAELYSDKVYTLLGADGTYFILENDLSSFVSKGQEKIKEGNSKPAKPPVKSPSLSVARSALKPPPPSPLNLDWLTRMRLFVEGDNYG